MSLAYPNLAPPSLETLEGRLLTPAGADGLRTFEQEFPPYLVIDEAFTDECEQAVSEIDVESAVFTAQAPPPDSLTPLITYFREVTSQAGIAEPVRPVASWNQGMGSVFTHTHFNEGHSMLAYFNVSGEPPLLVFDKPSPGESHEWQLGDVIYHLEIKRDTPTIITQKSRQMILISGAATAAIKHSTSIGGERIVTEGKASLPHAAIVGAGEHRDRLMVYSVIQPAGALDGSVPSQPPQ